MQVITSPVPHLVPRLKAYLLDTLFRVPERVGVVEILAMGGVGVLMTMAIVLAIVTGAVVVVAIVLAIVAVVMAVVVAVIVPAVCSMCKKKIWWGLISIIWVH